MKNLLKRIYGDSQGSLAHEKIMGLIKDIPIKAEKYQDSFSQSDVILITYGDSIRTLPKERPLQTLHQFCCQHFENLFSTVHILPFYPYSSDDGFSVIDFFAVDGNLGTWEDITEFGRDFKMMFDYVLNHISAESPWFKSYLEGNEEFQELPMEVDPVADLSQVTRPRSLPLLTRFKKASGEEVHVWTTFSADQIDINYKSIDILVKFIEILLLYVKNGAKLLRLDAVAYLWKQIGTNCIHLPETHEVVKLFRAILNEVAPDVLIVTETNVPHEENISYFGNGSDEAQMVYNFTLPPLMLYSFMKQDISLFSKWAETLRLESRSNTFFNFTASHDGIGVRPLEGILEKSEIDEMVNLVKKNGGQISYKQNSDGSESPYEMNITYVDAYLNGEPGEDKNHIRRFLASQAIQLVLPGVPAVYIHSILGSHNWIEGVAETGRARTINRKKLSAEKLEEQLADKDSFRFQVFQSYREMIRTRTRQPAFHPKADFEILYPDKRIFAIRRSCQDQTILVLTNITEQIIELDSNPGEFSGELRDLLTGDRYQSDSLLLNPYQSLWLSQSIVPE
jgi:glucosylglycerate phosphorylase